MKYLAFDHSAINACITRSNDLVESVVDLLQKRSDSHGIDGLYYSQNENGILFAGKEDTNNLLVFDYENICLQERSPGDLHNILYKTFLFSVRFWEGMPFVSCEHIFGTNKAAVFPFAFTAGEADHVVIRRNPPHKDFSTCLFAYDFNNRSTLSLATEPDPDFRLFYLAIEDYKAQNEKRTQFYSEKEVKLEDESSPVLKTVKSDGFSTNSAFQYLQFDRQIQLLTPSQRSVVELHNITDPIRIEGPAGTGKSTSMILRAVRLLIDAQKTGKDFQILFITHSGSTQDAVNCQLQSLLSPEYFDVNSKQRIEVTTLFSWCSNFTGLSPNQLIESNSESSKKFQFELLSMAFDAVTKKSYKTYKNLISNELRSFLEAEDQIRVLLMLQYEFSIRIKGMASESIEQYRNLSKLENGVPLHNDDDVDYIFKIFTTYQSYIQQLNVYDTDDVAIEALSRLDGPMWRRNRETQGYDYIFADEIHLFNLNEQQIIHYLTKDRTQKNIPICFALDHSQAIGERGDISNYYFEKEMSAQKVQQKYSYSKVFRNSPYIIDLCAAITASGATMFQNFNNPYYSYQENFDIQQKKLYTVPELYQYDNDDEMKNSLETHITELTNQLKCPVSEVAVIFLDGSLIKEWNIEDGIGQYGTRLVADNCMKSKRDCRVFVSTPEFINGLEFSAVILPAIDKNRVPAYGIQDVAKNFLKYSALNQLYLSCSRAKFGVRMLENTTRGRSECLEYPISKQALKEVRKNH